MPVPAPHAKTSLSPRLIRRQIEARAWGATAATMTDSPLRRAMAENGTEAGAEPLTLGADEWVARLAELPLAFHPGEGWRYHHSFGLLGILLARLTGRRLDEHLAEDLFVRLG